MLHCFGVNTKNYLDILAYTIFLSLQKMFVTDTLVKKYKRARSNLEQLRALGATILHEVNATKMKHHIQLCSCKFDRIVFNFPHAGFYGKEDNPELIKYKLLLMLFFFAKLLELFILLEVLSLGSHS